MSVIFFTVYVTPRTLIGLCLHLTSCPCFLSIRYLSPCPPLPAYTHIGQEEEVKCSLENAIITFPARINFLLFLVLFWSLQLTLPSGCSTLVVDINL